MNCLISVSDLSYFFWTNIGLRVPFWQDIFFLPDTQLMLDTWNESIFSNIKNRLQDSAMKLVHAERLGEAFDSQLVIGVRESYGMSCAHWPSCLLALITECSSYKVDSCGRAGMIISAFWIDFFGCRWYVMPIKFCLRSLTSNWFSCVSVTTKSVFSKSKLLFDFLGLQV